VKVLADNDQTVRDFNDSLAGASTVLEQEREELSAALKNLGVAMEQVSSFVKENEQALSRNVKGLRQVSEVLVRQRDHLEEVLEVAPTALANLFHTYNPKTGTLDARANLTSIVDRPIELLCTLIMPLDPKGEPLCNALREIPGLSNIPPRRAGTGEPSRPSSRPAVEIEQVDTTLAGILEETR
jgi:ABC-type transporter Mla subunit MlaD